MPEAELKDLIAQRLTMFMNSTVTTDNFDIYRSSWRSNPNIGGAYSFTGVETDLSSWADMAKPLSDRSWFFAGEHTINTYRGTTHGALFSGQRAAKEIFESKKGKGKK
jgi:monoamine oxidase